MAYAAETVLNAMPILYAKNPRHILLFWQNKTPVEVVHLAFEAKHPMHVCVSDLCLYCGCMSAPVQAGAVPPGRSEHNCRVELT